MHFNINNWLEGGIFLFNFSITDSDLVIVEIVEFQGLLQGKQVFIPIITGQGFSDFSLAAVTTRVSILSQFDRAIIVDAIQTRGGKVGDVYRLRADDFGPCLHVSCAHDVDFATALELGREIGLRLPKDITIVAVEVRDVTTFGEECTPVVQVAISTAVDVVLQELESAGCAGWQVIG